MRDEDGEKVIYKREFEPGNINSLQIPVGLAVNSGMGLMNPFGGQEGYEAAVPILRIAARLIMYWQK